MSRSFFPPETFSFCSILNFLHISACFLIFRRHKLFWLGFLRHCFQILIWATQVSSKKKHWFSPFFVLLFFSNQCFCLFSSCFLYFVRNASNFFYWKMFFCFLSIVPQNWQLQKLFLSFFCSALLPFIDWLLSLCVRSKYGTLQIWLKPNFLKN